MNVFISQHTIICTHSSTEQLKSFLGSVKVTCYILPRPEGIKEVKQAYQDTQNT
jgi:hypothetical protein